MQSNSWLGSGVELSATVTSTSPRRNDRRGNVENVTLAKLVNGSNFDGRFGNGRTPGRSWAIMRNDGVIEITEKCWTNAGHRVC